MSKTIKILLLEDDPLDAELNITALEAGGYQCKWECVQSKNEFIAALDNPDYDLILIDYNLPGFDGLTALNILRKSQLNIPAILVSGNLGEELAIDSIKAGAVDYVHKDRLGRLVRSVKRALEENKLRVREREQAEDLARLAEVVKQASITVAITDLEGDLVYINPYFEDASGFSAKEALGEKLSILKSGFQDDTFYKELWDTITSGKTWQGTLINKHKDGSRYHEDASIFPIKTKDGKIINFAAVKQDITERKRAEEQIRLQLSRLDSLHKIDTAISGSTDVSIILDVLLEQAQKELGVDSANLLLFKPSLQSLHSAARVGFNLEALTQPQLRLGKGLAGKVALQRETIQVHDLRKESDLLANSPQLVREGFVSYVGVPLLAKGKLKGVLEVYHRSILEPDVEWLSFLDTLARQAAIAVDSISLYENLDKRNVELRLAYEATLEGWAHALELRDMETEGHSRRVTKFTTDLAFAMGLDGRLMDHVRRGALLHDIGKMGIPDDILKKEGPLTDEEWVEMKKHPVYAYEMQKEIIYLKPALDIPYSHHEKWDGSGYPLQLSGNAIPLSARIFAIIDVYDALKADRPYRKAWPEKKILAHIREQSGKHFDPQVVDAFFKMISENA